MMMSNEEYEQRWAGISGELGGQVSERDDDFRRAEQYLAPTESAKKRILNDPIMYSVYTQCEAAFVAGIRDERKRALPGIPDPAGFVAAADAAVKICHRLIEYETAAPFAAPWLGDLATAIAAYDKARGK